MLGQGEDAGDAGIVTGTRGTVSGQAVITAAVDPTRARGALSVADLRALERLFLQAQASACPLLLLLDSAGARLDEGLAVLGAFRRLFGIALSVKRSGTPIVAIVGGACYGGASMLACLAQRRIFTAAGRMAMSGPRVLQAASGEIEAGNATAVEALFGGAARARLSSTDMLALDAPAAMRAALGKCLRSEPAAASTLQAEHRALRERLQRAGIALPGNPRPADAALKIRMDACFAGGFETLLGAGVVRGVRLYAGREVTLTGLIGGAWMSADAAWMIAESIMTSVRARPERPIVLLYDSPGHAVSRADESVLLSAYVAHLAETLHWAREHGVAVSTWIVGQASGGAYVALTAAAQRVLAFAGADIRLLPQAAIEQVLAIAPAGHAGPQAWTELGVVDAVVESDTLPAAEATAAGLLQP